MEFNYCYILETNKKLTVYKHADLPGLGHYDMVSEVWSTCYNDLVTFKYYEEYHGEKRHILTSIYDIHFFVTISMYYDLN